MTGEKRKEKRKLTPGTLYCSYSEGLSRFRNVPVLGIDESRSGIGIYTVRPLIKGTSVRVGCFRDRDDCNDATVMWCNEVGKLLYRVGLSLC